GDIRVVAKHGGQADHFGDPVGEREVVPALDLVRLDDRARGVIDGTAEADADSVQSAALDAGLAEQLRDGLDALAADALGALGQLAVGTVVDAHDAVLAARRDHAAVGARADRVDEITGRRVERADLAAVGRVERLDLVVAAAGDELRLLADEHEARHLLAVRV